MYLRDLQRIQKQITHSLDKTGDNLKRAYRYQLKTEARACGMVSHWSKK